MQTPPEIVFQGVFQGVAATPAIEDAVATHIAQLEQRWGRITACRVVIKGPSEHHRQGGLYEVHVRLALPDGREVNVGRTTTLDERRADLSFALNDAFKRARRQLQDRARKTEGQVKHHEAQPIGTVTELNPLEEFGIIQTADGQEIYFHRNSVLGDEFSRLQVGSRVTFAEKVGDKGPMASTVKLLGKHGLRT